MTASRVNGRPLGRQVRLRADEADRSGGEEYDVSGGPTMPIQPPYLVASKNLGPFLEALRHAQAPEKFGVRFVEQLGFKSTNDRLFLPLLKAMKFLDDAAKPTARYHSFFDDTEWKRVLGDGVRDAYSELFRINRDAHTFTREQLAGKLKSLTEGKLSPAVLGNIVRTFLELVKFAEFSAPSPAAPGAPSADEPLPLETSTQSVPPASIPQAASSNPPGASLVYRIEIVLPAVRDQAVYDAIFRSAREHLLGK
jgi:hypothetical protein